MRGYKNPFDDDGLDRLYRQTPRGVEQTQDEIAIAAGARRQTIHYIEHRAMQKIRVELERRRITREALP
jgi:DNA-directed RNA polymerase sigma subunit (sigma70/sigma32)